MVTINLPPLPINRLDSVATIAALRAIASASLENGQDILVDGNASVGDGYGGLFTWSELSVAPDNGQTVIKPTDVSPLAAGRWILISGGAFTNEYTFTVVTPTQSTFTLPATPPFSVVAYLNGVRLLPTSFSKDGADIILDEDAVLDDVLSFVVGEVVGSPDYAEGALATVFGKDAAGNRVNSTNGLILANTKGIYTRNFADTANLLGLKLNASDQWEVGGDGNVRFGPVGLFGYDQRPLIQTYYDAPLSPINDLNYAMRTITRSIGDNTNYRGVVAHKVIARDRDDVTGSTKGVIYGLHASVVPIVARNNVPFDDAVGVAISNETGVTGATATDAVYVSANATAFGDKITGVSEWYSIFTADCNATVGIQITGRIATYAMDIANANLDIDRAIRFPNEGGLWSRDAADTSDRQLIGLDSSDAVQIGLGTARTEVQSPLLVTGTIRPAILTIGTLPAPGNPGFTAYATNCRVFNGAGTLEGPGAGTGGLVVDNGTAWKVVGTNITASA